MAKIYPLSSLIHANYPSEAAFAEALGWTKQRLNMITNGKQEPDLYDVKAIAEKLDRPFEEIALIFLNAKSPNDEQVTTA